MMTCHHGTNKLTCRMCAHELDHGRAPVDPRMYVEGLLAEANATIAELRAEVERLRTAGPPVVVCSNCANIRAELAEAVAIIRAHWQDDENTYALDDRAAAFLSKHEAGR
jgi:hypothetical protein